MDKLYGLSGRAALQLIVMNLPGMSTLRLVLVTLLVGAGIAVIGIFTFILILRLGAPDAEEVVQKTYTNTVEGKSEMLRGLAPSTTTPEGEAALKSEAEVKTERLNILQGNTSSSENDAAALKRKTDALNILQ